MISLTDSLVSDTILDVPMKELVLTCTYTVNGKEITRMLHIQVSTEQFEQYNNAVLDWPAR